jgi:type IV pilus assembly protein PilY1
MWERTYDGLGMSRSVPTIIKIGGDYWDEYDVWHEDEENAKWLAVFGSGPHGDEAYEGKSDQPGRIYVIDIETGDAHANATDGNDYLFTTSDNAVINWPRNLDYGLTYEVNAVYFGESATDGDDTVGRVWSFDTYDHEHANFTEKNDPLTWAVDDAPGDWKLHLLLETLPSGDSIGPVTAPMNLSMDNYGNTWVYFGTGKFVWETDKTTSDQQYLFGLKDPLYNEARNFESDIYNSDNPEQTLAFYSSGGLLEAHNYRIYTDQSVKAYEGDAWEDFGTFTDLLYQVRYDSNDADDTDDGDDDEDPDTDNQWLDGWVRNLETNDSDPSERCISQSSILGGAVFTAAYTPSDAECSLGGDTNLYGLYYETGTAFYIPLVGSSNGDDELSVSTALGQGSPPSTTGLTPTGKKVLTQLSTGQIVGTDVDTAINYKSRITNWHD